MDKEQFLSWLKSNPRMVMKFIGIFNSLCVDCKAKLQSNPNAILDNPKKMQYCDDCIKRVKPFLDNMQKKLER